MKELAAELNKQLNHASAEEILKAVTERFGNKIAFATSLGYEDQVITHMIAAVCPQTGIFTLDTGRLFPETYELIDKTNARYKTIIKVMFPERTEVEEMVSAHGINLFYDSITNRKLCCNVRKTNVLKRALSGLEAWITGLRSSQSVTRNNMQAIEWDEVNSIVKVNPLINWSEKDVISYIKDKNVPYHALHDKGFPSIGCQPCTRAIEIGEDIRAGRWWWELPEQKECGLHKASN